MPYKDPEKAREAAHKRYLVKKGTSKVCIVCRKEYPNSEFLKKSDRPSNRERRSSYCHSCRKEKLKENARKTLYGVTPEQYKLMVEDQEGKCAICFKDMARACVDHRWSDGRVRELLCVQCNALIGQAYEDITILRNAIAYLEKHE